MRILGISAFYHDSAACILNNGDIVAAAQEERFSRRKHDAGFPKQAIAACLRQAALAPSDLDAVVFYEKPFLKFERLLETYLAFAPRGFPSFAAALPVWVRDKLFMKSQLLRLLRDHLGKDVKWADRLLFSEHHLSHAASAFYPSPFEAAAVLTLDGVGEWTTTSMSLGDGAKLDRVQELKFPHSLGLLYSAFTYFCGFKVNSGEYKLMGLAPYGEPVYADLILETLVDVKEDGSFHLDQRFFNYCTGMTMTNSRFADLFGGPPRTPESAITQREMNLAASVQQVTELILERMAQDIRATTGARQLCLSGGVALNCVANGHLLRKDIFDDIWIQPAAGDAGGALGAAFAAYHGHFEMPRKVHATQPRGRDKMKGTYLGPAFTDSEAAQTLDQIGAVYHRLSPAEVMQQSADLLANGAAIGWMQGAMEFGPRALGARSILADPRPQNMQRRLNLKTKFREDFRPFAPCVLAEHRAEWFDLETDSPYMLMVAPVAAEHLLDARKGVGPTVGTSDGRGETSVSMPDRLAQHRSSIPAVTHIDNSARVQTVHPETNPRLHALLEAFHALTDCPVLVNTSFNVRGEPIVCNPEDAFRTFMGTDLDALVIGNLMLEKSAQDPALLTRYEGTYDLD